MACLPSLTIWYYGGSGYYETPIQNPPCTVTTVRKVLSQTTLSLDNCYSTSRSGDPIDLDGTRFDEVGTSESPTIYKISCPEPAKPLYSHGHIDTLHMRYVQDTATDYSAMRGPCPEGFHIPLASEWSSLISKPGTGSNFATNLKIPLHAKYLSSTGNKGQSGESRYHCADKGKNLVCKGSAWLDTSWPIGNGLPIRAFKDVPVVPDSSWNIIFDGSSIANNSGIFRNQTMGLISISSDGINWLTIQDKNLGAANVGNTGYYYQWGNCHGFNWEKQTVTSSTQINASTYGPNNYYSSSTFITADQWDSSNNKNLRGGVTGIVPSEGHREPVYYGPQPTLWTEAEILNATDLDTLMAELNSHPEEYYNMLLDGENCIMDNPCTDVSYLIMQKSPYNSLRICGVYIAYTPYNKTWNWEPSMCPI